MAFEIIYSIEDEKGKKSTTSINLPTGTTFSDVTIFAGEMAVLINNLITGAIRRIGIAFTVDLPGALRTSPIAGSDVEEGGKFQFLTTNGFYTNLRLPTFDESKVVAASRNIDLTDTDVSTFVNGMTTGLDLTLGGGSADVDPSDSRDEDIVSLDYAREQFVSSRGVR